MLITSSYSMRRALARSLHINLQVVESLADWRHPSLDHKPTKGVQVLPKVDPCHQRLLRRAHCIIPDIHSLGGLSHSLTKGNTAFVEGVVGYPMKRSRRPLQDRDGVAPRAQTVRSCIIV